MGFFNLDSLEDPSGCKRVALAHVDVILTTVHPNPENITDPDALWEMYAVETNPALTGNIHELLQRTAS